MTAATLDPSTNHSDDTSDDLASLDRLADARNRIREQIGTTVFGQDEVVEQLLTAIFAGGHCILEGVPGLAKTLLVSTLAKSLSLDFSRVQFTPDLMPADITGTDVIYEDRESGERQFRFVPGPIFANLLLADEINRTPPKTQAALLQGMQEGAVSAGGTEHALPVPFFVLATQNPIEQEGTYPLPEAQLDRFLMKVNVAYPTRDEERQIYRSLNAAPPSDPEQVLSGEDVLALQMLCRRIPCNDLLIDYVMEIVRQTRPGDGPDWIGRWISWGAGPRGGQSVIRAAKARAALAGRPEVEVDDIQAVARPVLRHRMMLTYTAEAEGQTADTIIGRLIEQTPVHSSDATRSPSLSDAVKTDS